MSWAHSFTTNRTARFTARRSCGLSRTTLHGCMASPQPSMHQHGDTPAGRCHAKADGASTCTTSEADQKLAAAMSRRQALRAAGLAGLALGLPLGLPGVSAASEDLKMLEVCVAGWLPAWDMCVTLRRWE